MISLVDLLSRAGVRADAMDGTAKVSSICSDSRKAAPGCLFVCMPSKNSDSHSFIPAAVAAGATAVVVHSIDGLAMARKNGVPAIVIKHEAHRFNDALCRICNTFFDYPTRKMKVIGITGTNGKTTTAWLIRDMLQALGLKTAYIGTLGFHLPDEERELANTTPFPIELYSMLAEARDKGVEALAMEVSSHALEERRAEYVEYDAAVFTNLTQDHLDFHGSMDTYEAAKFRLFTELPEQSRKQFTAVINKQEPTGERWLHELKGRGFVSEVETEWRLAKKRLFSYSVEMLDEVSPISGDFAAYSAECTVSDLSFMVQFGGYVPVWGDQPPSGCEPFEVKVPLGGSFNVKNAVAAAATVMALGWTPKDIALALSRVRSVPGRFEAVANDQHVGILVDYAHTPDALEKLLEAVRPLTSGKVITVFGCGGDRDRTKRPKMARAASERSDITVVTSDNPRTEDPQAILDEVVAGIVPGRESIAIIDRGEAVSHAIRIASPGDVVVIAGKGHENYQIIGRTKYPMDDRELAREGLRRRSTAGVSSK